MFFNRFETQMNNASSVLKLFVFVRILSAIFNPIDDCDEVFNFYEPVSLDWSKRKVFETKRYVSVVA